VPKNIGDNKQESLVNICLIVRLLAGEIRFIIDEK